MNPPLEFPPIAASDLNDLHARISMFAERNSARRLADFANCMRQMNKAVTSKSVTGRYIATAMALRYFQKLARVIKARQRTPRRSVAA